MLKPALELLAYCHEMPGKIKFDQLNYTDASGHFQEMNQLGEELNNPDIIALSMLHQVIFFDAGGVMSWLFVA